ncbi:MAG: hypothetical protein LUC92_04845 [Clostridiales bacterium]|nr:hypothetical protein [Clostridiales bacterium]
MNKIEKTIFEDALFNQYKNRDFTYMTNYINNCIENNGFALTPDDIKTQLLGKSRKNTFEEFIDAVLNNSSDIKDQAHNNANLLYNKEGRLLPLRRVPIKIRATVAEKAWLYFVLADPKTDLFLEQTTKDKLKEALSDNIDFPLKNEYIDIKTLSKNDNSDFKGDFAANFKIIAEAISQKSYLTATNTSFSGKVYADQKIVPYKIEYSPLFNSFSLSCYPVESGRPVKMNLKNLSHVKMGEKIKNYDEVIAEFQKNCLT